MLTFLLCWLAIALVAGLIVGPWLYRMDNPPQSVKDEVDHGVEQIANRE
jgi:uncharacterized membrane-anchored protein YhcB (DUF1043 family)